MEFQVTHHLVHLKSSQERPANFSTRVCFEFRDKFFDRFGGCGCVVGLDEFEGGEKVVFVVVPSIGAAKKIFKLVPLGLLMTNRNLLFNQQLFHNFLKLAPLFKFLEELDFDCDRGTWEVFLAHLRVEEAQSFLELFLVL